VLTDYEFRSEWHVPAPHDQVFDVLADIGSYPLWWPQVRAVARASHGRALLVCRSALPYSLEFVVSRRREDRESGVLEAGLEGELDGWARWIVSANGSGTDVVYEQRVVTARLLLRLLAPLARPVLKSNHSWMMRGGERGLRRRLGSLRPATSGAVLRP
jgi:hypothetical protein